MAMTDIELDVELLKKEVSDMKEIHGRLDTAITKITDVSNCINRMLAVHEEKIANAEEAQAKSTDEFTRDIKELHGRITSTHQELRDLMTQQHRTAESSLTLSETIYRVEWQSLIDGVTLSLVVV